MPPRAGKADSTLLVIRRRYVGDGMREDITLRNTSARSRRFQVKLAAEADFADLFEVKGRSKPRAAPSTAVETLRSSPAAAGNGGKSCASRATRTHR